IICHRENVGPAGSRNTILDNSSGKYIAFFDDDDTSDSMRIAQQVADIERQMVYFESCDVVTFCSGHRRYSPDFIIKLNAIGSQMQAKPSGSDVVDYLLFGRKRQGLFFGTGTPSCAMLAPVELLKRVGGFDKGFRRLEDAELCVRLAAHGTIFSGTPERVLFQNVSHALDKSAFKNLKAELKLVQKHRSLFRDQHQIVYAKRKHLLRYYYFQKNLTGALRTVAALQRNPAFSFVQDVFLPLIRRVKKDMKLG
ncbi:MAG: glycosyltransferase, partial [Pseudomonadota bacterium]|nr:glycosyltransferase [Pseudomonadota bacterium]